MARHGVDPDLVIETAAQFVDRDGWTNLTMTALAKQLGVRTPSLYSHVGSIDEVLSGVQARTLRALGDDLQRAAMGRTGAEAFHALAQALRTFAVAHPGTYALAMGEPIDTAAVLAASAAAGGALTATIRSFGVDDVTTELLFTCLAQLHGVLVLDEMGLFRGAPLDIDAVYSDAIDLVVHRLVRAAEA